MFKLVLAALLACGTTAHAQYKVEEVDLILVLAVDSSMSITAHDWDLQIRGYEAAFRSKRVINAITRGNIGAIGITMVHWAGSTFRPHQKQVVRWHTIRDAEGGHIFAQKIAAAPRAYDSFTYIGQALRFSTALLKSAPYSAPRSVIDISGDGPDNSGIDPRAQRDAAINAGVTINGLPIGTAALEGPHKDIVAYYRDYVVGGPHSFYIPARDLQTFGAAIIDKLVREIVAMPNDKIRSLR